MEGSLCAVQNPNPTGIMPEITQHAIHDQKSSDFQLSDYLVADQDFYGPDLNNLFASKNMLETHQDVRRNTMSFPNHPTSRATINREHKGAAMTMKMPDKGFRISFRTKSNLEVMDDGYKWRKYGKKMVKSSPNPRNYYKCSSGDCKVKKRVERDKDDSSYVLTTYEGVHNHETPSMVYQKSLTVPMHRWTLQGSYSAQFSSP